MLKTLEIMGLNGGMVVYRLFSSTLAVLMIVQNAGNVAVLLPSDVFK